MFKKTVLISFIVFTVCSYPVFAQKISLCSIEFPPYCTTENNIPVGAQVDIVKRVFEKAGIPYEINYVPFARAIQLVKEGGRDGLFNFYKNEERIRIFKYSEPMLDNPLMVFVRKDSKIKYARMEDLKGLRVGVMRGYTYGLEFDKATFFTKDPADNHESSFKKLDQGRIDVYICDKNVALYTIDKHNLNGKFKMFNKTFKVFLGHVGFKPDFDDKTLEKINKTVRDLRKSGELDRIIANYLSRVIKVKVDVE